MRLAVLALLTLAGCAASETRALDPSDVEDTRGPITPDLLAARELDQQGVRAFAEGRFADAARFFRGAYRFGGPPSELWNIARSRERMNDAETAVSVIVQYLASPGLSAQDRGEAERELAVLRARSSALTVTTSPEAAAAFVDGKPAGGTPLSLELKPGVHTLALSHDGYPSQTYSVDARYGRAILVSIDFAHPAAATR